MVRIDKLIADRANVTRSEARELIKGGRVTIDGLLVRSPERKFDDACNACLDGRALGTGGSRYIMMNKPEGIICATRDSGQKTVLDLLPDGGGLSRKKLFPVGRLDKDTTGLLILTDDGDYGHRVTHPNQRIMKRYEVFAERGVLAEDAAAFASGVALKDGTVCLPARLEIDACDPRHCFVEIFEGKYHQIKRMFGARENRVTRLKRISIGGLELDPCLKEGEHRLMTGEEALSVFTV